MDDIDRLLNETLPAAEEKKAAPRDPIQLALRLATISFAFMTPKDEVETEQNGDYIKTPVFALSAFLACQQVFYKALTAAGVPHAKAGKSTDELLLELAEINLSLDKTTPTT